MSEYHPTAHEKEYNDFIRATLGPLAKQNCHDCLGRGVIMKAIPVKGKFDLYRGTNKPDVQYKRSLRPCRCVKAHASIGDAAQAIENKRISMVTREALIAESKEVKA